MFCGKRRALAALCLLPLLIGGCGVRSNGAASKHTLRVWYSTDDPVERGWAPKLAQRFQKSHPNVDVNFAVYSFEDMNTKLQLSLNAGDPPDLAYVTPRGPGIPAYVRAHRLRDLASAARQRHWAAKLRPGLLAAYNQPFKYYGAKSGSIVAAPSALAAVGILYNARLLKRLRLTVPRSLSRLQADLPIAKRAGYVPLGMGNGDGWLGDDWYLTLVNSLVGPRALEPEQRLEPFSFHQPPFLRAGRMLRSWSKAGYFTPNFGGLDAQEGVDQFFHGMTLFQLVSSSENSQIQQDERQTAVPIGVFAFPRTHGGTVMPQGGYEGWIVPKAGKEPALAESFIDMMLSPSTANFLGSHGWLPSARAAVQGSGWLEQYQQALGSATPGIYLDAAPVANLNATMEANVQLLLQGYENPTFLTHSLQESYASRGKRGSTARIDGEF